MDELDLLKKHWNKDNFPKVSSETFSKLIHKSSSSTVKWIFIISLIEFGLGILASVYMSFFSYSKNEIETNLPYFETFLEIVSYLFYGIILYFIIRFYKLYKQIAITDNAKKLMSDILETRKVVKHYILFNISIFFTFFMIGGITAIFFTERAGFDHVNWIINTIMVCILIIMASFGTFLFWLFYKLIYGWLLRKLERNYKNLEQEEEA